MRWASSEYGRQIRFEGTGLRGRVTMADNWIVPLCESCSRYCKSRVGSHTKNYQLCATQNKQTKKHQWIRIQLDCDTECAIIVNCVESSWSLFFEWICTISIVFLLLRLALLLSSSFVSLLLMNCRRLISTNINLMGIDVPVCECVYICSTYRSRCVEQYSSPLSNCLIITRHCIEVCLQFSKIRRRVEANSPHIVCWQFCRSVCHSFSYLLS